jgi:hypothetical protein
MRLAYPLALAALLGYCLYSALTEPPPAYPPGRPSCSYPDAHAIGTSPSRSG